MKNVKKLLKKAMVFTVAASMLIGTPLTASAAGIRGVYSIQDGDEEAQPGDSGTGTVTNTDTGSGALADNDAKIIGIVLDKENVNAEKGTKESLKATVVLDGKIYKKNDKGEDVTDKDGNKIDITEDVRKKLSAKIRWELSFADGSKDANPAATVSVKSPTDENGKVIDKSMLELNPKKGTKKGKEVVVTAKINNSYYVDDQGEVKEYVRPVGTYEASATVFVKEYSTKLELKGMPKPLLKHTIDLNDYLVRTPLTANDTITWITSDKQVAAVTAAGVVTFKKANKPCTIYAVGEKGVTAPWSFIVEEGVQSSRIEIVDYTTDQPFKNGKGQPNKADADLRDGSWQETAAVVMYAKVKNAVVSKTDSKKAAATVDDAKMNGTKYVTGNVEVKNNDIYYFVETAEDGTQSLVEQENLEITDTITWTSNKPAVVSVEANDETATLDAVGVGTAVITAKTSSGKPAKLTVVVKATLTSLTIDHIDGDLYSGQSQQMTFTREPEQNKDGVKWSIAKVEVNKRDKSGEITGTKMIANPNATINAKGLLKIKPKLTVLDVPEGADACAVTVVLESKTKPIDSGEIKNNKPVMVAARDEYTIQLEQSSLDSISVRDDAGNLIAQVATDYNPNNGKATVVQKIKPKDSVNTTYISVPKNRTYTATVEGSKGLDYWAEADTLTWTTSNAKVASISYTADGKAEITANASGKATITVSGIRAVDKPDNGGIKSASVIKTTFKVEVKQPVNTVTLNKTSVSLNEKTQKKQGVMTVIDQKVDLKATLGPKGVKKEAVYWSVKQNGKELTDMKALGLLDSKGKEKTTANVKINLPAPAVGDVFEITAKTETGAYAVSTVTVVKKTTSVAIAKDPLGDDKTPVLFSEKNGNKDVQNTKYAVLGDTFKMYPCINVGKNAKTDTDFYPAGTDNCENVAYSVDKKGKNVVSVDNDGTVHAIGNGTAKITAKTPLGKSATLTVKVELPKVGEAEK